MQFRSSGGVYIGAPSYEVQELSDGWAVFVTRWYRRGDEKDFDTEFLRRGLSTRVQAEAAIPAPPRMPCKLPAVGEAYHALMNGAGYTALQRRAAARVWLKHFGEIAKASPMRPIYDLAKQAEAGQ